MRLKRLLVLFGLIGVLQFSVVPGLSHAQFDPLGESCRGEASQSDICQGRNTGGNNPISGNNGVLTRVVNILSIVVSIAAVIIIIVAGIRFTTSGGDSNAVKSARDSIIYALVGIVVVLLARSIILYVVSRV